VVEHSLKHAPTAVVALAVVGVALAYGGYELTARGVIAIAVWWAIILGLGLALLPLRRPTREAYLSGCLFAGLALLALLSVLWSASAERSFIEFDRMALYLGFFILAVLAGTHENLARWANGLAIGIAVVGLLALTTRLFPGFVPGGDEVSTLRNARSRLSFPLGYWNALGILVAIAFPLLLRSATVSRSTLTLCLAVGVVPALTATIFLTGSRGAIGAALVAVAAFVVLARPRAKAVWACLCAAAGAALAVGVLSTLDVLVDRHLQEPAVAAAQGRGFALALVGIGVAVALLYAGGLAGARGRTATLPAVRVGRRGRLALGALVAAALVALVVASNPVQTVRGFQDAGFGQARQGTSDRLLSADGSGRYQFWGAAVDQFRANPVIGDGAGAFELWWAANPRFPYFIANAHSLWLETLGELGVAGLVLLVGAFGYGLVSAARRLRGRQGPERVTLAALCAALLAWAFGATIDWVWEMPVVTIVAVICLGLMTGPATLSSGEVPQEGPRRARRGSRSFGMGVAVIAAAWLVICSQASPLLSQMRIDDSRAALARGENVAALRAATAARTLQPWAASPYRQLAVVEEQRGRLAPARAYIGEALDREPGNFELWEIAARIEIDAGDFPAAGKSLERSRRLNPAPTAATVTP